MALQDALNIAELLQKIFTILAITIGGLWAYYNFFRGRTYKPRLEAHTKGQLFTDQRYYHLLVSSQIKNVGLSNVDIEHEGSGIRIYSYEVPTDITDIESAQWDHSGTFPVFESHRWIEPGETIEDEILLSIAQGNQRAFRAVLRVVGQKVSWKTETILYAQRNESKQNEGKESPNKGV